MVTTGELDPQRVRDTDEFTAALRTLKERSGLTYRQLEERAAENGEVLPRSTLADVLRGRTLPRTELLAAFVRACGDGHRVAEWLEARENLVRRKPDEASAAEPVTRSRRVPVLLVSLVAVVMLAATAWALVAFRGGDSGTQLPEGRAQIRPALANGLCLTDGHADRYDSLVAVQRPCDEVAPQETTFAPLGGDTFRIQWYHPDHGLGCLKALTGGSGAGLLEPWDACEKTTRFRIVPTGPDGSDRYSIRVDGQGCVGIRDSATSEGAEAVVEPCRPKDSQVFVIRSAS